MKYYITIDTGTTNTRVRLLDASGAVLEQFKANIGVKNTAMDGNNSRLVTTIKEGIREVREKYDVKSNDICKILASGMITSDMGIYELPHLIAPAGIEEFRRGSKEVMIPEVCEVPITFIPGIKNDVESVKWDNFEEMDIIRGEEVETIALLENLSADEEYLLILPGSHTKFVSIGKGKKILGCLTTLSGELIEAVTNYTLITSTVNKSFVKNYDKDSALLGYHAAEKVGLSRAIFSTRILGQFVTKDTNLLANYLLGLILQSDVEAIRNTSAISVNQNTHVLVAGKTPLKEAIIDIFKASAAFCSVSGISSVYEEYLSARGAWLIFQ